jgi:hypothetical protein
VGTLWEQEKDMNKLIALFFTLIAATAQPARAGSSEVIAKTLQSESVQTMARTTLKNAILNGVEIKNILKNSNGSIGYNLLLIYSERTNSNSESFCGSSVSVIENVPPKAPLLPNGEPVVAGQITVGKPSPCKILPQS